MAEERWEQLEDWLYEKDMLGGSFTSLELAASMGITRPEASWMIQAYLHRQRRPESDTSYVLKRQGRTTGARWSVGQRKADVNTLGDTLVQDVATKIKRAYAPDMRRIATINKRQARDIQTRLDMLVDGAMNMLAAAVRGIAPEDDSDED